LRKNPKKGKKTGGQKGVPSRRKFQVVQGKEKSGMQKEKRKSRDTFQKEKGSRKAQKKVSGVECMSHMGARVLRQKKYYNKRQNDGK